jgi:SET domain-containing protein
VCVRTDDFTIDPCRIGNAGRFLNHSCQPNLAKVSVRQRLVFADVSADSALLESGLR